MFVKWIVIAHSYNDDRTGAVSLIGYTNACYSGLPLGGSRANRYNLARERRGLVVLETIA